MRRQTGARLRPPAGQTGPGLPAGLQGWRPGEVPLRNWATGARADALILARNDPTVPMRPMGTPCWAYKKGLDLPRTCGGCYPETWTAIRAVPVIGRARWPTRVCGYSAGYAGRPRPPVRRGAAHKRQAPESPERASDAGRRPFPRRSRRWRQTSRAVRRVLSPGRLAAAGETAIHLGPALLPASCGLPANSGGPPSNVRAGAPGCSLLTLLRVGFT